MNSSLLHHIILIMCLVLRNKTKVEGKIQLEDLMEKRIKEGPQDMKMMIQLMLISLRVIR